MYNLATEFEGLKLKRKAFKFSSKKAYNQAFNDALMNSPLQFIRLSKQEFDEKIHIAFSWMILTKGLAYLLMSISVIFLLAHVSWMLSLAALVLSFSGMIASKLLGGKVEDLAFGKSFVIEMYEMNNYENLKEVRQELIKEKDNNDETPA